jgi:hypothetical protein
VVSTNVSIQEKRDNLKTKTGKLRLIEDFCYFREIDSGGGWWMVDDESGGMAVIG